MCLLSHVSKCCQCWKSASYLEPTCKSCLMHEDSLAMTHGYAELSVMVNNLKQQLLYKLAPFLDV